MQMKRTGSRSTKFLKSLAMAGLLALGVAAPVQADSSSPVGRWQSVGGEARYDVSLCGDGTQLCAKLTWLRSDARTAENVAYLNRYVIHKADQSGDNKWSGTVTYEGENIRGSVTLVSSSRLKVNGCRAILCQTIEFVKM